MIEITKQNYNEYENILSEYIKQYIYMLNECCDADDVYYKLSNIKNLLGINTEDLQVCKEFIDNKMKADGFICLCEEKEILSIINICTLYLEDKI